MRSPRTARGNRIGIGLVGAVCVAGGLFCLGLSENLWWSSTAHQTLVTGTETRWVHAHDLVWILAAAVAALLVLVLLRWLLVQGRRANTGTFRFETDPTYGQGLVPARVLARAVADDVVRHEAVASADAELVGPTRSPELRLTVVADDALRLGEIRTHVETEILDHARDALGVSELPLFLVLAVR